LITGRTAKVSDDAKPKRRHKYGAKRTEVDGIWFDSKAEAKRYVELCILVKAGLITNLDLQPAFMLQESFLQGGKRTRSIKYIADFQYIQDGKEVVEDVKGKETEGFKLKRRLFLKRYPDLELRIVHC